jgi:AraC-like DNA-binding protein
VRPQREFVASSIADASWILQARPRTDVPFEWHYHPEYELIFTMNARGQRFVGDSCVTLGEHDLVLVGANLPHAWSVHGSLAEDQPIIIRVCWFSQEWLDYLLRGHPELAAVGRLCMRAAHGLAFPAEVAERFRETMLAFEHMSAARRLPALLGVLVQLAEEGDTSVLASGHYSGWVRTDPRNERLTRVLSYLHEHYAEPLDLADLAARAALSVGAFHRFFRRHLQMTVTQYVANLRVGQACQWLIESEKPIKVIAAEVGYTNLAHFNRQFRAIRDVTPRDFRARYRSQQ